MKRITFTALIATPSAYAWWWALVGNPGWGINWAAAITYGTAWLVASIRWLEP